MLTPCTPKDFTEIYEIINDETSVALASDDWVSNI